MEDFSTINGEGTILRSVQLKMLELLLEFDRICKNNNLTYWIDFGTLLGAVRHKGFIPWDDDIDLSMPSKDYKRFQQIAASELRPQFVLQTEKTEPNSHQGTGLIKIRMKDTLYLMGSDNLDYQYSKGLFIDIFDSVSYPTVNRKFFKFIARRINKSRCFFLSYKNLNFGNIVRYFIFPVEYVFFYSTWKLICFFKKKDRELTPIQRVIYGYPTLKTEIHPLKEIEFEGHLFPCPNNPDARLRDMFGDYLTIPPLEKRKTHTKFICLDTTMNQKDQNYL